MSLLPPDLVREQMCAELEVIDAAQVRLRGLSTDLVGNAFRIEVAGRLETQERVTRGLSYRVFGQIADPPDGPDDAGVPPGVQVVDLLRSRLQLTAGEGAPPDEAGRPDHRAPLADRAAAAPGAAGAGRRGGGRHGRGGPPAGDVHRPGPATPRRVAADRDEAEQILVKHAQSQDPVFVAMPGRTLAEVHHPDGVFDDQDRAHRRGLTLGAQGVDGMSKLSGYLTPTARAAFEAVAAAVRPGHHVPGSAQPVVDAGTDPRTTSQRLHDAFQCGLGAAMASGRPGRHSWRGKGDRARRAAQDDPSARRARQHSERTTSCPHRCRRKFFSCTVVATEKTAQAIRCRHGPRS